LNIPLCHCQKRDFSFILINIQKLEFFKAVRYSCFLSPLLSVNDIERELSSKTASLGFSKEPLIRVKTGSNKTKQKEEQCNKLRQIEHFFAIWNFGTVRR